MYSFLVLMTSCKLAHCLLQTLLPQTIHAVILAGSYILKMVFLLMFSSSCPLTSVLDVPSQHLLIYIKKELGITLYQHWWQSHEQERHGYSSQGVYILVGGGHTKTKKVNRHNNFKG